MSVIKYRSQSRFFLGAAIMSLGLLSPAYGRIISIETQLDATVQPDGKVEARVKVTNKGDEPAQSVYVKTQSPDSSVTSPLPSALVAGASQTVSSRHSLKGLPPGRYPLIVYTHYADGNGYPFSALTMSSLQWNSKDEPEILGTFETSPLHGRGKSTLKLKNLEGNAKNLHIRFIFPAELSAEPAAIDATLAPHQETSFSILMRSFSALAGSTYIVYALVEFDQNGRHHTMFAPATVEVFKPGFTFNATAFLWMGVIGFVIAILIGVRVFWEKRRSR